MRREDLLDVTLPTKCQMGSKEQHHSMKDQNRNYQYQQHDLEGNF